MIDTLPAAGEDLSKETRGASHPVHHHQVASLPHRLKHGGGNRTKNGVPDFLSTAGFGFTEIKLTGGAARPRTAFRTPLTQGLTCGAPESPRTPHAAVGDGTRSGRIRTTAAQLLNTGGGAVGFTCSGRRQRSRGPDAYCCNAVAPDGTAFLVVFSTLPLAAVPRLGVGAGPNPGVAASLSNPQTGVSRCGVRPGAECARRLGWSCFPTGFTNSRRCV